MVIFVVDTNGKKNEVDDLRQVMINYVELELQGIEEPTQQAVRDKLNEIL